MKRKGLEHKYYVPTPGVYDVDKIRQECINRQRGDIYYAPCSSELHFHKVGEECNDRCEMYSAEE